MKRLTAFAAAAALTLALAPPASADHGYQSFKFINKTKEKVLALTVVFDRKLSHVGDENPVGWRGVQCELSEKNVVDCQSTTPFQPGDDFKLSVATPAKADGSYSRAKIEK